MSVRKLALFWQPEKGSFLVLALVSVWSFRVQHVHLHVSSHCLHQAQFTDGKQVQRSEAHPMGFYSFHPRHIHWVPADPGLRDTALPPWLQDLLCPGSAELLPLRRQPPGHYEAPAVVGHCPSQATHCLVPSPLLSASPLPSQCLEIADSNSYTSLNKYFSSVQLLSRVWLFTTPWIAARQASLSITNSRSSPRLTSIESVMPTSHVILCHPLLLLPPVPPSIRVFSNESTLHMKWPKYWSFSFSIIPSKEIPGLISFRMDWLDLLAVQEILSEWK